MTAAARIEAPPAQPPRASAVEVFMLRCRARARLWSTGEIDLHTAVDELQASAVASGLIDELGQDEVQRLMAEAFGAVRDIEAAPAAVCGGAAASTLMAAEYLVQENDVERFRTWLDRHSAQERTAIHKHLEAKQCRSRQTK